MPLPLARFLLAALLCGRAAAAGAPPAAPPETVAVMRAVFLDEAETRARYEAFARKADAEGFPRIAGFLRAVAASEGVHARNAQGLLSRLGTPVEETPLPVVASGTTKENLRAAAAGEIRIIERVRPVYLRRIAAEGRQEAIASLKAELEVEREHLSLLKKIQASSGLFFSALAKRFERAPIAYYVCQACGAMYFELPRQDCAVCRAPASRYLTVR